MNERGQGGGSNSCYRKCGKRRTWKSDALDPEIRAVTVEKDDDMGTTLGYCQKE